MTDSRVSWRHGEMRAEADAWVIEDFGSTNGTFLGAQRLDRIDIREECVVRLGNPDDGPVLRCVPQVVAAPPAAAPPPDHPGTALSMPAAPAPAAPEAEPEPAPRPDSESWWQPAQEP
ncbi:MAG TPA: FHA domain-containing protein, partial [Streptosporangiaceae bacterium]|nr:FHA domain-containing protein [Streptosporangiaceae bacterium]